MSLETITSSNLDPLISVIVPVYNGGTFLNECLDALFSSNYKNFEIVVVDDGSTDSSSDIAKSKGAVVLKSKRKQSGPAAARNLAANEVTGDLLLFVDADVVVKPDTLNKFAAAFEKGPDIAAVFGSYDDMPAETNFLSQYKNLQHHYIHQISNPEASTFWAGLGAIRTNVFLSIGGFDCEQFKVPSIEDIELGVRLRQAGCRIVLDREIQGKHLKKWTASSLLKTEIFCRAVPWSKLILTRQGLINDLNLKTNDRLSAALVAVALLLIPFLFWNYVLSILCVLSLCSVFALNWKILSFYGRRKGWLFALMTFPWLISYFLYSGTSFIICWFWYSGPFSTRSGNKPVSETR
jgi:glycosyltransferase involved in cell wall biosynthesis